MKVTEVMLNFRHALLAVIPSLDKVHIPWRRPDAYDEWDTVASALFRALVVEVLRWSLPDSLAEKFRLPEYDLLRSSYADTCFLEVTHATLADGLYIFHSFGTNENPFDIVELRRVSRTGEPHGQNLDVCPVADAIFRLRLDPAFHGHDLVEEVTLTGRDG